MILKRCNHCGKNVPVGKSCKCVSNKMYLHTDNKYTAEDKLFYKSADWIKARELCIQQCYGIDLYSYFVDHRIEYGQTVHHIVPLLTDYSLRVSQSNLIYLTESNHRKIHKIYQSDYIGTVKMLNEILREFSTGVYQKLL